MDAEHILWRPSPVRNPSHLFSARSDGDVGWLLSQWIDTLYTSFDKGSASWIATEGGCWQSEKLPLDFGKRYFWEDSSNAFLACMYRSPKCSSFNSSGGMASSSG
jgi:hypothetical protein